MVAVTPFGQELTVGEKDRAMSENMKSGMVLLGALLLGGLMVAGLVQQVEQQRAPEPNAPSQPASPVQTEAARTENVERPSAVASPAQPLPEQKPAIAPEASSENAPAVDFFGKPLTAFDRQVNERVGIAGQVEMAGRPVPGATVVLRRVSKKIADGAPDYTGVAADPPGGQEWTAVTDGEGKYAFYGLDDGHYGLQAYTDTACGVEDMTIREGSIPGRLPGKPSYFAARGELAIELWPSGTLAGTVLTPDGQPVAGASLYPYEMQYPTGAVKVEPIPQVFLGVQTGTDGAFRFPRLPAGRWQLAVRAEGYTDQTTDWLSTADPSAEIRLKKSEEAARPGTQPTVQMAGSASTPFNISDYRGKYVLLDFWAVWCGPCRGETPNIKAVYEEFKNDPRFILVGLDLDANAEDARKYIADNSMGWTHVFLGEWSKSAVTQQYRVEGIPCLILLDPDGKELARDLRGAAVGEAVRKALSGTGARKTDETAATPAAIDAPAPEAGTPATATAETDSLDGLLKLNLDVGFDYSSEGFPMGLAAGQSDAQPSTERPCKTLSAEPAYHSKQVYYGYLRLGNAEDNRFVYAIDESDKSPWFGYFDRNNNGDLTDDGPPCIISANVEFDVAVVLPNGKTVHRPYKIWQWPNNQTSTPSIRFYSVCHHQAKLHVNGQTITAVAFEQYNHDALYHDDGIWLDVNGDNRIDEKTELFKDGSTILVKGKPFQLRLNYP
jgi:thiol-disulfide isomerase/thioredoxin